MKKQGTWLLNFTILQYPDPKIWKRMKCQVSISKVFWGLLRKSLLIPIASRVFPALFSTNFSVSGQILRSLIHFELILVQGDRRGCNFSTSQTPRKIRTSKTQNKRSTEIIKIRAEINEIDMKKRINETKSWLFEKMNKIGRRLANLSKMRRGKTQISKIRNAKGEITTNIKEIQGIISLL
jgi:hypothetical protein